MVRAAPSASQRTLISELARYQGATCKGSYYMVIKTVSPPYPAARIQQDQAAWRAAVEKNTSEGWYVRHDVTMQRLKNAYHYRQISFNGTESLQHSIVHTFHLKSGQVVRTVDAGCDLQYAGDINSMWQFGTAVAEVPPETMPCCSQVARATTLRFVKSH